VIELYVDMVSQPSRAVYWLFLLCNIPHTLKLVKLLEREQRSDGFLKINPLGTVPAINDNGFSFNESATIVRYLKATRDIEDNWYPDNIRERVTVDRFLDWHHSNTRAGCAGFLRENYLFPRMGIEKNEAREKFVLQILKSSFKVLCEFWLKDDKYIGGLSNPSFADLQLYSELKNLELIDFDFSQWPKIQNYMKRIEKLPHYQKVHAFFHRALEATRQINKPKL